jgi:hypothetical protein
VLRPRRAGTRGAVALVLLACLGAVLGGGLGAVDLEAAMSAQARVEAAADAVAHGVAALLLADPGRDGLSVAVQAGTRCDTDEDRSAAGEACGRAVAVARDLAAQNHGVLRRLIVGADPRDMLDGHAAGRLLVEARVFVARGLPILPGTTCPAEPGSGADMCWADAWSAAQGAG